MSAATAQQAANDDQPYYVPPAGDPTIPSGPQINQDRYVDYDYCYKALARHDDDGNLRITRDEYLDFAQDFGGRTECLGHLSEMPIELVAAYNQLSCECLERGGDSKCCLGSNANIPVTGVDPKDETTLEEQQFLRQTCLRTDQAIITFCGHPPPPVIPPLPPGSPVAPPVPLMTDAGKTAALAALAILVLLCCCCRRRWFFVAGPKEEEEESSDETEDLELGPGLDFVGTMEDDEQQDGDFGGTSYGRTVEEPEYEEELRPRRQVYDQFDVPEEEKPPIVLKHVEKPPPPPPEEDPYALEHYVPDGGIVEYEREGEWSYDADGGWTPQEREKKAPVEFNRKKYNRADAVGAVPIDNRRARQLETYGGGDVFAQLDDEHSESGHGGGGGGMFDWVIRSTISTLNQKEDDLVSAKGSDRGSDMGSVAGD